MSDEVAVLMATELGLDPGKVLIDLYIERESGKLTSPVWRAIRARLETAVMPAVVGFAGYAGGVLFDLPII